MTLPDRRTRSHSQFNDWIHCAWAFRLKRVMKVQEQPSVWLPGGKAFHTAAEEFDIATWGSPDLSQWSDPEPWRQAFVDSFERQLEEMLQTHPDISTWRTAGRKTIDKPNGEDLPWWHEAGQQMITDYVNWRISSDDTWEIAAFNGGPAVEVEVKTQFGGVPVIGYVDRLFRSKVDGQLVLVDLKTGSRTPASPTQLAQYSIQLERVIPEPIRWGAYYSARHAKLVGSERGVGAPFMPIDLSLWTEGKFGVIYDTLDKAATQGLFLPRIDSHCKACGVRSSCVFQGGTDPEVPTSR